jgi:YVTN family beta-propeller protein
MTRCRRSLRLLPWMLVVVIALLLVPAFGASYPIAVPDDLGIGAAVPSHLLTTITVRCGAASAAVDPAKDRVYAAGFGCVSIINGATNRVIKTLSFDGTVTAVAFDPAHDNLYVAINEHPYTVEVIDAATYRVVKDQPLGGYPTAALYASGHVFVTYATGPGVGGRIDHVAVFNTTTMDLVARVAVGSYPGAPTFDSWNHNLYVANATSVFEIRISDHRVISSFAAGQGAAWMFFDPRNGNLYLAHYNGATVSVVDPATQKIVLSINVGASPRGLAFDPANNRLYAANADTNDVSVIDPFTETVVQTIPTGYGPDGEVFDAANQEIYVTNAGTNTVTVLAA